METTQSASDLLDRQCLEYDIIFDATLGMYSQYRNPETAPARVKASVRKFVTSTGHVLAVVERALINGDCEYTENMEISLLYLHQARLSCIAWLQRRLPDAEKRVAA